MSYNNIIETQELKLYLLPMQIILIFEQSQTYVLQ